MTTETRRGRPPASQGRDLKGDLLRNSRRLLDEGGVAALSLREVARRTGCTHQAPYHYFADREALLAALVAEGFDAFADRLAAANDLFSARGSRAGLIASGRAYVAFALDHPGVFRIMFRPDLCDPAGFPEVRAASARALGELERLNTLVHGPSARPDQATLLWAHAHGLACLLLDGPLGQTLSDPEAREAHLATVSAAFADLVLGRRG